MRRADSLALARSGASVRPADARRTRIRPWTRRRFVNVESAALCMILAYVLLKFEPFVVLRPVPGAVSAGLFPAVCLSILVVAPVDTVGRIPISWWAAALAVWQACSWSWTIIPYATMYGLRSEVPSLFALTAMVGLVRTDLLRRRLLQLGAALAVWGVLASLALPASRDQFGAEGSPPFRGTFGHKNDFGIFMVLTLCLVLTSPHGRWRRPLILLCIVGIVASRSATAGTGLFAALFVWGWITAIRGQRSRVDKAVLGCLSVASLVGAALLSVGLMPTLLDVYEKDITFSGRTYIWTESLTTIWRRPMQGYGFQAVWADGLNPVTSDLRQRIGFPAAHAHNGAMELTLQVGLIGLALFAGFLVQLIGAAVRCLRFQNRATSYWAILTTTALVMMSVSEPLFGGPYFAWLVLIWVALRRAEIDHRRAELDASSVRDLIRPARPSTGRAPAG